MEGAAESLTTTLSSSGKPKGTLTVSLSHELVHLLSEQLYNSPLKAIEELVVNSYDADADECRIFVPSPSNTDDDKVIVYDDGNGMNYEGLVNLWHIGRSNKREDEVRLRATRKQIGKFGIGKLATYTIANKLTYITRTGDQILTVSINFGKFTKSATGADASIQLPVLEIVDWKTLSDSAEFIEICRAASINLANLFEKKPRPDKKPHSWTIALLQELKPKSKQIKLGRLRWVLSTAMPISSGFRLYLNGEEITSSKEDLVPVVEFQLSELPEERLKSVKDASGEEWRRDGNSLVSSFFPSGVVGRVFVTEQSLFAGKSADLGRSHGFFIRVMERLVNEEDALFGLKPRSYQTFNRFRADIRADDLDAAITAPREGVEESSIREVFKALLSEIFNEARQRYQDYEASKAKENDRKKEDERNYVNPRLVEHPVGDVLATQDNDIGGSEPDESWFYIELDKSTSIKDLVSKLYGSPDERGKYSYKYTNAGKSQRLVKFNPATATFLINEDHELVQAHADDGRSKALLEDLVTAEALLEIYLREQHVSPSVIGEVLERRDTLLRSLAKDHPYSLELISQSLRDSATNQYDLEIALVTAARALGFVAKHISGAGEPDGLARLTEYPGGQKKITLEAKSSISTPELGAIDFAGLQEHVNRNEADGCLLVSPSYPGQKRADDSAAATRARDLKISCWTVEQLARVVGAAESRHITAQDVLDIVLNKFSPDEVTEAVERLFEQPSWNKTALYKAILETLRQLEGHLSDKPRTSDMVAAIISTSRAEFAGIQASDIEQAAKELASASQGGLIIRSGAFITKTSIDEIERRLRGLTRDSGEPRRLSLFRSTEKK